jgi:hypothetical protein
MLVDKTDGSCSRCNGQLDIVDVDDVSMTVFCLECEDSYDVETDAFGDGCVKYYIPFMVDREFGEEEK